MSLTCLAANTEVLVEGLLQIMDDCRSLCTSQTTECCILIRKLYLSNIPPYVSDDTLVMILLCYGKLVSPIKKILIGTTSPLLKHVVSFRRFVYMTLKDSEELDLTFNIRGANSSGVKKVTN